MSWGKNIYINQWPLLVFGIPLYIYKYNPKCKRDDDDKNQLRIDGVKNNNILKTEATEFSNPYGEEEDSISCHSKNYVNSISLVKMIRLRCLRWTNIFTLPLTYYMGFCNFLIFLKIWSKYALPILRYSTYLECVCGFFLSFDRPITSALAFLGRNENNVLFVSLRVISWQILMNIVRDIVNFVFRSYITKFCFIAKLRFANKSSHSKSAYHFSS